MKRLLKRLVFWKKDNSKEEQVQKALNDKLEIIEGLLLFVVESNKVIVKEQSEMDDSLCKLMQGFQEQLDQIDDHFEQSIHTQLRQLNVIRKDIEHVSSRSELSSRNSLNTYNAVEKISERIFAYNREKTIAAIGHQSKPISAPKFVSPIKIYSKKGNLNYRERRLISDIEKVLQKLGVESFHFDTACTVEELIDLHAEIIGLRHNKKKKCEYCAKDFLCSHKLQKYCPNTECKESARAQRDVLRAQNSQSKKKIKKSIKPTKK